MTLTDQAHDIARLQQQLAEVNAQNDAWILQAQRDALTIQQRDETILILKAKLAAWEARR